MRRIAFSVLILLGALIAVHANGNKTLRVVPPGSPVTPPPPITCPFSIDNGCATSIVGQAGSAGVLLANARLSPARGNQLNALTGSTTDYSNQAGTRFAGENFPAVDYWVGEYMPLTSLKDPLDATVGVVATTSGACTYLPTGGAGSGPLMHCFGTISGNMDISGFDFTRGGTTCIPLDVENNSNTGTVTIKDNYWLNVTGNCSIATNTSNQMLKYGWLNGHNEIAYNTLDMNAVAFPFEYGSCGPAGGFCNPGEAFVAFGDVNVHHNAFLNFSSRPLQYSMANPSAGFLYQYNYLQGCCTNNASEHGEFEQTGASPGGQGVPRATGIFFKGNTFLATTAHHTSGDSAFSPQFATTNFIPIYDYEDNFYVAGSAGGATASAKVTGTTTTGSSNFTTTLIASGTYGSGEVTTCTTAGGNNLSFLPIYAGSTGTSAPGPAPGGHSTGNATTWPMTYDNNNDATLTGGLDDGTTPHATFTGSVAASSSTLTVSSVTNTIHIGDWLFGTSVPGSATITAGSGTTWTVSFTAGSSGIGSEAMTSVKPGNVLTVTDTPILLGPPGLSGSLDIGTNVVVNGSRAITAKLTGSGTAGTYTVAGAAGAVLSARATVAPIGIFAGSWAAGNTATCSAVSVSAIPFTVAWQRDVQTIGTFTSANNTFDLYAYNASPPAVNTQASTIGNFNGTITAGTPGTLTVNSGTVPVLGTGLSIVPAGIIAGSYVASGSGTGPFVLGVNYASNVGPEAMTWQSTMCSVPANLSGNVDLSGTSSSAAVNGWSVTIPGSGCSPPTLACTFFTSPTGSDSNAGTTLTTAFKTPGKAQTAMEALGTAAATTCMEGGTYAMTSTLSLTSANDANKTWIAYTGQVPVLDGGNTVAGGISIMESGVTINGLTVQNFTTTGIQCGNGGGTILTNCSIVNNTILNETANPPTGGFTHTFAILMQDSNNSLISGNTVSNDTGDGIAYGTNHDTVGHVTITGNTLSNICSGTAPDCAAIYNFNNSANQTGVVGFVVSHNTINGFGPQLTSGAAPACLYTDDGASNVAYSFNICTGSGTYGFLIHGGYNVTHTNDIFDLTNMLFVGLQQDCTTGCPSPDLMTGDSIIKSIVYSSSAVPTTIWRHLSSGGAAATMTINGNLYWNTTGTFHNSGTTTFDTPSPQMIDPSPTVADPLFVAPATHNYALQAGSPAHALGF